MNCPDCDSLMFKEECPCGFKVPAVSTIEIKQMGAQETNYPVEIDEDIAKILSSTKLTGRPFADLCFKYCMDILNKGKVNAKQELLRRDKHVN